MAQSTQTSKTPDQAKKKAADRSTSQPVSPRTPQTIQAEQTNVSADSGGPHVPKTSGNRQDSGSTKKSDLKVFRVLHDGHDRKGNSLAAAGTPEEALQVVGDAMVLNDLGHTHGTMRAVEIPGGEENGAQFKPSQVGVIAFDNGKHTG